MLFSLNVVAKNNWKLLSKSTEIDFSPQNPHSVFFYIFITPPLCFFNLFVCILSVCMHCDVHPSPHLLYMYHLLSWDVSVISLAQT